MEISADRFTFEPEKILIIKKRKLTVFLRPTAGWPEAQGPSYASVETHSPPAADKMP